MIDRRELPVKPFLYTLDQVAGLLQITEERLPIHYAGRSVGARQRDKMLARNIAAAGERPDWRIAERELIRWARTKGFRFHERGHAQD